MKTTLKISSRGVVTLPAEFRRALGLNAEDQIIAETTPDGLLLRPAVTLPVELYSEERIREFDAAEEELSQVLSKSAEAASARVSRKSKPPFTRERGPKPPFTRERGPKPKG